MNRLNPPSQTRFGGLILTQNALKKFLIVEILYICRYNIYILAFFGIMLVKGGMLEESFFQCNIR